MDAKDREILRSLQNDAKTSQAEIGRRVGLSAASVHERIRKLERDGIIRAYAAMLDPVRAGYGLTAFVQVFIEHPRHEKSFFDIMRRTPEIQECHYVTGEFTCLLKVRVRDRAALRALVLDRLNAVDGVGRTKTLVVLETLKEDFRLALARDAGLLEETR